MNVCVIKEDNVIAIDGEALNFTFDLEEYIWAVQWNGTTGEIEFSDGTPNQEITDFTRFQYLVDAYNAEKTRIGVSDLVSLELFRMMRNSLLDDSDWRTLEDYPNTDKEEWKVYRQELRDATVNYTAVSSPVFPTLPGSL